MAPRCRLFKQTLHLPLVTEMAGVRGHSKWNRGHIAVPPSGHSTNQKLAVYLDLIEYLLHVGDVRRNFLSLLSFLGRFHISLQR
jgi:hypothetical protein